MYRENVFTMQADVRDKEIAAVITNNFVILLNKH